MNENDLKKRSAAELEPGKSDWSRIRSMTDEEIDAAIADDPDASPVWTDEDFARAAVTRPDQAALERTLEPDVAAWLVGKGPDWVKVLNEAEREYAQAAGELEIAE